MAKKVAKKASSSTANTAPAGKPIVREICFGVVAWGAVKNPATALLILPFPRFDNVTAKQAFAAEYRSVYTELPSDWENHLNSMSRAHDEGRVIFGWSPYRAKERALKCSEWNAFCRKWFGLKDDVLPIAYSVEQLHFYVDALVKRGFVKICGNAIPKPEPEAPPKKKGVKRAPKRKSAKRAVSDEEDDEPDRFSDGFGDNEDE